MKLSPLIMAFVLLVLVGCQSEPTIYPVTGTVTLGKKPYPRLIVYMQPTEGAVTSHNMGVGETDEKGKFTLATSAGEGIAAGNYRVSFSCYQSPNGGSFDAINEKPSESGGKKGGAGSREPVNIVPAPYDSSKDSPVEFTVGSGENHFEFDIPRK